MQGIVNLARGSVRVEVEGAYPERFMNICAENEIGFWDLERVDEVTVRVTMTVGAYKKMRPFLDDIMCTAKPVKKRGVPFFLWRIRKRYALIAGLIAVVVLTWVMSLYIWDISVVGNDAVSASEILEVLDKNGVSIGTYGPSVDSEALRNKVLLELEDLSWITVNVNGSKATVIVRERVEVPDMLDEDSPGTIVAEKSGVIDEMIIFEGTTLRAVGDSISEGDDIVSGVVESISSGIRFLNARGEIYARTWYEFAVEMPLEYTQKSDTGDSTSKKSVIIGGNRINLYINSGISYEDYDKIVTEEFLTLPGGVVLPIKIATSTYNEYQAQAELLTEDKAVEILKEQLLNRLKSSIAEDGEILETEFEAVARDGMITVTLKAECREQIGTSRALTDEEMTIPEEIEEDTGETNTDD